MNFRLEQVVQFCSHVDKILYSNKQKGPCSFENFNSLL